MMLEIKAPSFPESISDGTVATWHKKVGEAVLRDEVLVDIETDKVVMEVVAPADGRLSEILKPEGETVLSTELIGLFEAGSALTGTQPSAEPPAAAAAQSQQPLVNPAARRLVQAHGLTPEQIAATGKGGRLTKGDVLQHLEQGQPPAQPVPAVSTATSPRAAEPAVVAESGARIEKRVPMTRLRASVARRLVEAQQTAAMLTTFNEVNMQPVMELRTKYRDQFEKRHGVRLGFMSFFVRASVEALKRFPAVNASVDGNDIVYHGYQDIGVAVSTDRGLVVPILRDAAQMSLARIEAQVRDYGLKARDGKLTIEEMQGGTFTLSNGGVFGSLLSTPILNPPQTAILGMHKVQERPMAVDGKIEILPMMYLALSYDHRLIDGREAVQFLVAIKDFLEDPARILLDL